MNLHVLITLLFLKWRQHVVFINTIVAIFYKNIKKHNKTVKNKTKLLIKDLSKNIPNEFLFSKEMNEWKEFFVWEEKIMYKNSVGIFLYKHLCKN